MFNAGYSIGHVALPCPPVPTGASVRWALLFDVDGTIVNFADDPSAAHIDAPLLHLLQGLHRALEGAVAVVSGRTLESLDRLFANPPWTLVALHGVESCDADGIVHQLDVPPAQVNRMREVSYSLAAQCSGVRMEDKGLVMALHCPGGGEQLAILHEAARNRIEDLPGYELQPGRNVVEFKPVGVSKGTAVQALLSQSPFMGRTPVYLGDDLSDEHAFAVTNRKNGMSVRVGTHDPTQARFALTNPAAVRIWLNSVLETFPAQHTD